MTVSGKLENSFVLLSGSISTETDDDQIVEAHKFVERFVEKVIEAGGGFVVYLSGECSNSYGKPLLFDWSIVSIIDRLLPNKSEKVRLKIVASERALKLKASSEQRKQINSMISRGIALKIPVEDRTKTGGEITNKQIDICDLMVCLGGGKGVFTRAMNMSNKSLPVLALDLEIGALSEDGKGALDVLEEFQKNPTAYLPYTGNEVLQYSDSLSLEDCVESYSNISQKIIDIFYNEEQARVDSMPPDVLIITALPVELEAIKDVLGISDSEFNIVNNSLNIWNTHIVRTDNTNIKCAVAILGGAGISNATAVTSTLINQLKPKNIIMLGIAGGMVSKLKFGDTIFAELVIEYESAAFVSGDGLKPRPRHHELKISIKQDIDGYISNSIQLRDRLIEAQGRYNIEIYNQDKQPEHIIPKLATVASGDKLFKDEDKFNELKKLHDKVTVVEMEGAGVFAACKQNDTPVLMIRGISDNANFNKNDDSHNIAATNAAIVTKDFIEHGLNLNN